MGVDKKLKKLVKAHLKQNLVLSIKQLRKRLEQENEVVLSKDKMKDIISILVNQKKIVMNGKKVSLSSPSDSLKQEIELHTENRLDCETSLDTDHDVSPSEVDRPEIIFTDDGSHPIEVARSADIEQGNATILLFYTYCTPVMTRGEQDAAIAFCYGNLSKLGVTGRLRVGREGFNGTLTGMHDSIRAFTAALQKEYPHIFGQTDFKFVDGQPERLLLKELKVWPVTEIVTYGFDPRLAPLEKTGAHLSPPEFHEALAHPDAVVIDVRNFNETLIGRFDPPSSSSSNSGSRGNLEEGAGKVLDPRMRRSTEFPEWVARNKDKLVGKKVLMYCTGGVRCERASAYVRNLGIDDVSQLKGGIHRYLEAFPDDGGFWKGKNYTFDKRFSHGAKKCEVISDCVFCGSPWDRYQAQAKCVVCAMEVLLCKTCQRAKPAVKKSELFCPLCEQFQGCSEAKIKALKWEHKHKIEKDSCG